MRPFSFLFFSILFSFFLSPSLTPLVEEDVDCSEPDEEHHDDDEDLVGLDPAERGRGINGHQLGTHNWKKPQKIHKHVNTL